LNLEINAALTDPRLKARLADLGGMAIGGSPADFGKLIAADTEKWGKVVKFAGIKPERSGKSRWIFHRFLYATVVLARAPTALPLPNFGFAERNKRAHACPSPE